MDTAIEQEVINARQRAAELLDAAFSSLAKDISLSGSHYLKALEEVGRAKMLKENLGLEVAGAPSESVISIDGVKHKARDARIQVALHFVQSNADLCLVKKGSEFVLKHDINKNELHQAMASVRSKLPFL